MNKVINKIWEEKYRPTKIKECILPKNIKQELQAIVDEKSPQNLLFFGKAGSGKTTAALAIAKELDANFILINCTEESGIDTLRTTIRDFASRASLNGKRKYIILDEFDFANQNSFQVGMRGAIEMFSDNCNFIITCNYPSKIIPEIHSRCMKVNFAIPKNERTELAGEMFSRATYILDTEKISYKKEVVVEVIKRNFPDFRQTIIQLSQYSLSGEIDVGILANDQTDAIHNLIEMIRKKDFLAARTWVAENADMLKMDFSRSFYDALAASVKPSCLPQLILSINDYQYKAAFVADPMINAMALVVEIMYNAEFPQK